VLDEVRDHLERLAEWEEGEINQAIRAAGKAAGARGKALFHPVRVALTGEENGPELVKVVYVLGRDRTASLLAPTGA
jgi:glutamyl/glutaminyl-tRNA synthetase